MADFTLYIANKNYSSWSLRGWWPLVQLGVAFDEIVVPLRQPESRETILRYSPSGKLPALRHGRRLIWDSLAIGEYLAEIFPNRGLWPEDSAARAEARSISAEMHSGFVELRRAMPMNVRRRFPKNPLSPAVAQDIARILAIWRSGRDVNAAQGPFLFGHFSLADAMYAPVVFRFRNFGVETDPVCAAYMKTVLEAPAIRDWTSAAEAEPWTIADWEPPEAAAHETTS